MHGFRPAALCALLAAFGCSTGNADPAPPADPSSASTAQHPVTIVSSRTLGTLEVTSPVSGELVSVQCGTCHGQARDPGALPESLHKDLKMAHGDLSCNMCHSGGDRNSLHLADGTNVAFEDTMTLCGQCHGPQTRDYNRGSHGGMTGYWDLTKGPRQRNLCTNCHDPHQPAYPQVAPAPGPRDRFLTPTHPQGGAHD